MKKNYNENDKYISFTKVLVVFILLISVVWVTWSYIIATISMIKYGDTNTIESVSSEVVRALIATIIGYLCKAYFETKQAERLRLEEKKFDNEIDSDLSERNFSD